MMSRKDREAEVDLLRDILVGSVVEAVDLPDAGVTEAVCKFTVRKGTRRHDFHLHATDLGWWIGEHGSETTDPDGTTVRVFESFNGMIQTIVEHLMSEAVDDWEDGATALIGVTDPWGRRIGFRCQATGRKWWVSISTGKGLTPFYRALLLTEPGRTKIAAFLGTHFRLPLPEEVA